MQFKGIFLVCKNGSHYHYMVELSAVWPFCFTITIMINTQCILNKCCPDIHLMMNLCYEIFTQIYNTTIYGALLNLSDEGSIYSFVLGESCGWTNSSTFRCPNICGDFLVWTLLIPITSYKIAVLSILIQSFYTLHQKEWFMQMTSHFTISLMTRINSYYHLWVMNARLFNDRSR